MAFYSAASNNSLWRGIEYFQTGMVQKCDVHEGGIIEGIVRGSDDNVYSVIIDLNHPKKSECDCPFAKGRKVICKHMLALYFTSVPDSYELFQEDMKRLEIQYEIEEKKWRDHTLKRIKEEVAALSAKEVRERLVNILYDNALDSRYYDDQW